MTTNNINLLKKNILSAEASEKWLRRSYLQCEKINFNLPLTEDDLDHLEALTSRFARLADILIHKVFRSIELAELEIPGTIIDTVNRMEKRGLIRKADEIRELKDLRNVISHEYEESHLIELMKECVGKTSLLFDILNNVKKYCKTKALI
jgi:uncharacterized protein YutE (UPF0331/DUF86 family)